MEGDPGGRTRAKSCSTTVLVDGTMTPILARYPTTSGTSAPPSGSLICGMTFRLQEHYQGGGLVLLCASLTTLETWPSQVEGASLLRK